MKRLLPWMFVPLALAGGALGWWAPEAFAPARAWIPTALGVVMFTMGLATSWDDVRAIRGRWVFVGIALQYLVMPLGAAGIAAMLGLPPALALGVVLVGACPGGTASNVVAFLARADVALSVAMTTASTLISPLMTPLWCWLLAGIWLDVPALALMKSTAEVVLLPVAAGMLVRAWAGRMPAWIAEGAAPLAAMLVIAWIIAVVVALNQPRFSQLVAGVWVAVALLNALGLGLGWLGARALGADATRRATIAIEVGMQNSGLAVALALKHFAPEAALAGALFSVWHNITGPLLALWWRLHR